MPKIYLKTIVASYTLGILTLVIVYSVLHGMYMLARLLTWLFLTLLTYIIINEKLTVRERWKARHYALLAVLSTAYAVLILATV